MSIRERLVRTAQGNVCVRYAAKVLLSLRICLDPPFRTDAEEMSQMSFFKMGCAGEEDTYMQVLRLRIPYEVHGRPVSEMRQEAYRRS